MSAMKDLLEDLDDDGVVTSPVPLETWCVIEGISRNTAYILIRAGILPAHKKNPTSRRSPWMVTPAEHRLYRRLVAASRN